MLPLRSHKAPIPMVIGCLPPLVEALSLRFGIKTLVCLPDLRGKFHPLDFFCQVNNPGFEVRETLDLAARLFGDGNMPDVNGNYFALARKEGGIREEPFGRLRVDILRRMSNDSSPREHSSFSRVSNN